ncbi:MULTISPECIES: hypothetical protein [unclassified Capnocytophaga]|uniref:hypothetical protein n=1 Tax=unclassified Capnocytophaga TaxID=2640652 RepID=UPI000202D66B|nr:MULTISPECIES: hypothetical protein [unclassified Capnocytophaga]EGD35115.1 hypothetical protein HMPREF9071_0406 [Capnocytophaga sp. oral taxon 338 str. F0234]MEB3003980.1 hypothetical protein [Capnocytophaga sp. G2]
MKKVLLIGLPILFLILGGWLYMRYFFVFGEGVKSGYLNYAVYKGDLFKTYEGKLIQEGFAKTTTGNGMQSNEFEFSIEDKKIFKQLEVNSGKYFDLHYKEYHNTVPWRGNTVYIVDSIVNMREK